ncbi:long-chain acyl-CoA synthetase [Saccharothrix tamanrassetensis]|uniref:Long-chain acyl-CoA synthetase n=1 Tax=Saccharothrix tamanrassetensis TaxID=1051531 RepID=A0A841CUU1_9PSEU|nr:long-chain fatty acid--CoA ligase [Saccharothrix tamanrassetensis]MBB5959715.1 long-chain acyl-CoA synthetase [Saccharothrix tamanrassetensis]
MSVSLAAVLAESAARYPDRAAVVFESRKTSYRELWWWARKYAAVLGDQGIGRGDRVALLLPNSTHLPMAYFGVLALGAVVVPVHALSKADEIEHVLRDSGAAALVCAGSLLEHGGEAARRAGVPVFTVLADDGFRLDVAAGRAAPIDRYAPCAPDDAAMVLYTSGTTGKPKGAVLTHLGVTMNITVTMLSPFDFRADDVLLGALPLFHVFGQVCGMCVCFRAGATLVLMPTFDAARAIELMAEHRCTVFMGVPTMYMALLRASGTATVRPRLHRAYSGGQALPVKVLEDFEDRFGCPVYEGYGLTETSPVVAYNQPAWPRKPGTVGLPVWGVEVAIARAEVEGRVELLPAGEVGEVVIRGHNVMAGYLNRPRATAEVLVDGWFRSGDLGRKDEDGYLSIVDRKKDVVLRGGYNVYPREVEEVLMRHPAVAQVAVIGVPHPTHGEEVCAVVLPASGALPGTELGVEIETWSKARMAPYKYPRRVEFVDGFPLGVGGKVLKRELVARFAR